MESDAGSTGSVLPDSLGRIDYQERNRVVRIVFYYCMTVMAQWKGVINVVTGKSKPVWEKAESTR